MQTPNEVFMGYAGENRSRWQEAVGLQVTHTTFGLGQIIEAEEYVHVRFAAGDKRFERSYLGNARFFADMGLPEHLETAALHRQRNRMAKERFADLKSQYHVTDEDSGAAGERLFGILLKVHASTRLEEDEVAWLEGRGHLEPLAFLYERLFHKTREFSDAIAAARYWYEAQEYRRVLDWLAPIRFTDSREESTRLVLRASAHRQMGAPEQAEQCIAKALKILNSYPAHNLLGVMACDRGDFAQAEVHFAAAAECGGSIEEQDVAIGSSLERLTGVDRTGLVAYLVARDPERYNWARAGCTT